MASAKKPASGKTKNPCPPPPKGKPPSSHKATGITQDDIGKAMEKEGSPAFGEGKKLVQRDLAKRDVTYEDGEETLPCKMLPEEIERLNKRTVQLVGEIETKKAQVASTMSTLNGELKAMQLNLSNLARKGREGVEHRMVPVRTFMDYPRCTVYSVRSDTGETLRSRAMERDELNLELNIGGKTFSELASRPLEDTTTVCE
jgi:hypothetical protein